MPDLEKAQAALDLHFHNPALLELALVHSSFLNERAGLGLVSNERLEFLGDAVLGFHIAEKLYRAFPDADEGTLTRYRSLLVRRETLARLAGSLDLGAFLYLGRGEASSGGRHKPANLSRALEAIIAAVYLDQGSEAAGRLIQRLFDTDLARLEALSAIADSKSQLQEIVQASCQTTPVYTTFEGAGAGVERFFTAEVRVNAVLRGRGEGRTKKEAEAHAARHALIELKDALHPAEALLNLNLKVIENEAKNMGQRDKGGREQKKVKKDANKPVITSQFTPAPAPVEVIKAKGKKPRGE
jgi:ribonuclease-3